MAAEEAEERDVSAVDYARKHDYMLCGGRSGVSLLLFECQEHYMVVFGSSIVLFL